MIGLFNTTTAHKKQKKRKETKEDSSIHGHSTPNDDSFLFPTYVLSILIYWFFLFRVSPLVFHRWLYFQLDPQPLRE